MPDDINKQVSSNEEGATATDAFMKSAVAMIQPDPVLATESTDTAHSPEAPADDKPRKWMGRYDTPEEMEEHAMKFQSLADQYRPLAEKANDYKVLLAELEENPDFQKHVTSYFDEGGAAPKQAESLPVQQKVDEYGVPTGELELDPDTFRRLVAEEARKEAQAMVQQQTQQRTYEEQIEHLKASRGLDDSQVQHFIREMNQPNSFSLEALYDLYAMEDNKARAVNEGRREVVDRIRQTQARGPAVGATTGSPEQEKSFAEAQADDIVRIGKKTDLENSLGL